MIPSSMRLLALIELACLASAARAETPSAPIRDDAGLFHADAIAHAEKRIDDIRRTFDRNLFVRTVASASPGQQHRFQFLLRREVNHLLGEQARKYADELCLPGIYVVICKKPRDVHVMVRPSDDPEFTHRNAETLRRTLARRLHDSGPDTALLSLVEQVHRIMQDHTTPGESHAAVNEFVVAGLLGGGLGLWILLVMIRLKIRAARPATPGTEDTTTQARSAPALLGAMFGFPAGMWIYDKLYPCPSGTPLPLCEPEAEPTPLTEEESMEGTDAEEHPREEHAEDAPVSP
ncbi:MAG TPA: hypothetical protein VMG10_19995 [Gemmataceae bacterium]|nr:hypothetical protein [Gemmataceae bacterium]